MPVRSRHLRTPHPPLSRSQHFISCGEWFCVARIDGPLREMWGPGAETPERERPWRGRLRVRPSSAKHATGQWLESASRRPPDRLLTSRQLGTFIWGGNVAERRVSRVLIGVGVAALTMGLSACGGGQEPPSTAVYIEGDWQCLTTSEDGNVENAYTYHLRVEPAHISLGVGRTGDTLRWSQYDYDLTSDGVLTTYPEVGGTGWTVQLPTELSFSDTNDARITEGWVENLEVELTETSAAWTGDTGLDWACARGTFEDDGNTFVEG